MREVVEKFVTTWERRSKDSMHLDALLHKSIREPLISGILTLIDQGIAEYQRDAETPKLTEKLVRDMTAKAKAAAKSHSEPVAPVLAPVKVETPPPPPARPEPPDEAAEFEALKAKVRSKRK